MSSDETVVLTSAIYTRWSYQLLDLINICVKSTLYISAMSKHVEQIIISQSIIKTIKSSNWVNY